MSEKQDLIDRTNAFAAKEGEAKASVIEFLTEENGVVSSLVSSLQEFEDLFLPHSSVEGAIRGVINSLDHLRMACYPPPSMHA